jgi:hypothetical protein
MTLTLQGQRERQPRNQHEADSSTFCLLHNGFLLGLISFNGFICCFVAL